MPLDLNGIDALLEELSKNNFIPSRGNCSADIFNQVLKVLSVHAPDAVDHSSPKGGEGSNLFFILMYQNLLLAKRVAALEALNQWRI